MVYGSARRVPRPAATRADSVSLGAAWRRWVSERSQATILAARPKTFARLARAALEKHLPEARDSAAHWHRGANVAWVRVRRPDGLYGYFGLRRHLGWVTGEAGLSREPSKLNDLVLLPTIPAGDVPGFRLRLGDLLHGEDRWWPAGSERELVRRLEQLALEMAVKAGASFRHWPGGER